MINVETLTAYLDGELAPEPAREVELALAGDPALAARFARLRRSDERVRDAFDAELERPLPARLLAAAERADRLPAPGSSTVDRKAPASPRSPAAPARRSRAPLWVGFAIAAQVSLILLAGFVLKPAASPRVYTALAAPARVSTAANMIVVFKPDATQADVTAQLRRLEARIVDGPTSTDALLVRVAPASRDLAIRALQARPEVALAAAIDPQGAPQ